jgi:hypothetical protein
MTDPWPVIAALAANGAVVVWIDTWLDKAGCCSEENQRGEQLMTTTIPLRLIARAEVPLAPNGWRREVGGLLLVDNASPSRDGTVRRYGLPVPPHGWRIVRRQDATTTAD